jgi:hypothetical protein
MRKVSILLILITIISVTSCLIDSLIIIQNPAYAIGTIAYYNPSGGHTTSSIHFSFSVKGNNYSIGYDDGDNRWNVPPSCSSCNNGNKFMVQYDSLRPNTARMLFSYQVRDSTDYKNDILLFKKNPPGYPSP